MEFFMYSVFEEKFNSDKGKSLVLNDKNMQDAQALYAAIKFHAKQSTSAHISGDALSK
jgi:hypothetical protein